MPKVALIATMAYPYDGRSLSEGDEFEASEKDANLLKLLSRAKDAPKRRRYFTQDVTPEATSAETTPRTKRQYRRRDMQPESE